jgi:hypothetical protein
MMKKNILLATTSIVIIAGLMNIGIGVGGLGLYNILNIPDKIDKIELMVNSFEVGALDQALRLMENASSKIESGTFLHELIVNSNNSLTSVVEFLDISIEQMRDISNSFYYQAEIFWDLSILWDSPETMREMGDAINKLHLSIDMIIPSLQMIQNNISDISSGLTSVDLEVEYFRAQVSSMLNQFVEEVRPLIGSIESTKSLLADSIGSLKMITPIVYLICTYFVIQGAALMSISLMEKYKKE